MSKTYKIPCSWEVHSWVDVEADSIGDAITKAESDDFPIPIEADYIEGSFEVDHDIAEEYNDNE